MNSTDKAVHCALKKLTIMLMKKLTILTLALMTYSAASFAQDDKGSDGVTFKKFKVDISFGYAKPQGSGISGGVLVAVEPKYAIMNQLSLGLRMEVAATIQVNADGSDGKAKGNGSYILTGDYYFNNNKFRPFAGAGAGIFTTASVDASTVSNGSTEIPTKSKFGAMARAGFEFGHLRFGLEYNFVADKAGYFGIKLGSCIGGGRK